MEGALAQSASAWDADGFICWWQTQRQHCGAAAWSASLEVLCWRDGCLDSPLSPPLETEGGAGGCSVSTARLQLPQPAGIRTRTLPISVSLMHREAEKTT